MPRYQPVRVRAYLQTPVVADAFLPLDGVLYALKVREVFGEKLASLAGQSTVREQANGACRLPLLRHNDHTRTWFYACSFAQWSETVAEGTDYWNKRLDQSLAYLIDFRGKRGGVPVSEGRYKAYRMPVFVRHALFVDWYAMATPDKLKRLLAFATHLGKKTSQGFGAVLKWEVEDWHSDWSVRDDAGRLMRAIPTSESGAPMLGVRPSYWNPRHQFNCLLPA